MKAATPVALTVLVSLGTTTDAADPVPLADYAAARIRSDAVVEASGLACHEADSGRVWLLNDGGSEAAVYAVDFDGTERDRISTTAPNVDWEDMTVLRDGAEADIVIGDVGDNVGVRATVSLYRLHGRTGKTSELRFAYPDGPRDAEAVAIDAHDGMAYVMSKRTLPAELYALPLDRWNEANPQTAQFIGAVESLPFPSFLDRFLASSRRSWHWQPTAMDVSPDGNLIAILTYTAVYLYAREDGMSFFDTLKTMPAVFDLRGVPLAESLCITGSDVILTTEGRHPMLYRIPVTDPGWAPRLPGR